MPHDKKGRGVEVGDHVKFKAFVDGAERASVGRVCSVQPAADTCNVQVMHLVPGYYPLQQAWATARDTELVLKSDGSEPFERPAPSVEEGQAGRARVGVLAILAAVVALAMPIAARAQTPPAPPEPKCGTKAAPKSCISITSGAVSVVTREARREYATVGLAFDSPVWNGFQASVTGDVFAAQDGAATDVGQARTFRVFKAGAVVSRNAGPLQLNALGGVTFSIEGLQGAPMDPRQWDGLLDLRYLIGSEGYIALRGGHDGAVGGYAGGLDVVIPVGNGAPAIVARYELPLVRDPNGRVPWVITGGARIRVASFRLFK